MSYKVVLHFNREQLLYDVRNYAYVESELLPEESEHARHMTADVGDTGNVDRITRLLDLLHMQAVEMLYPFTRRELAVGTEGKPWCNNLRERPSYEIEMDVPGSFSETTVNLLERLIHEWMVSRCVGDWLSITNTEKSAVWMQKAADAEGQIRTTIAMRVGRVRRKLYPEW